jgi:hypothetical protein
MTHRNLDQSENDHAVLLVGLDGEQVAVAQIPGKKVGVALTMDGRAFLYQRHKDCYVEVPTVILAAIKPLPEGTVVH